MGRQSIGDKWLALLQYIAGQGGLSVGEVAAVFRALLGLAR